MAASTTAKNRTGKAAADEPRTAADYIRLFRATDWRALPTAAEWAAEQPANEYGVAPVYDPAPRREAMRRFNGARPVLDARLAQLNGRLVGLHGLHHRRAMTPEQAAEREELERERAHLDQVSRFAASAEHELRGDLCPPGVRARMHTLRRAASHLRQGLPTPRQFDPAADPLTLRELAEFADRCAAEAQRIERLALSASWGELSQLADQLLGETE